MDGLEKKRCELLRKIALADQELAALVEAHRREWPRLKAMPRSDASSALALQLRDVLGLIAEWGRRRRRWENGLRRLNAVE